MNNSTVSAAAAAVTAFTTRGPVFAVLVEGDIDAIWDTSKQAAKEARDLRAMDCGKVTVREFATEAAAYDWADSRR